MTDQTPSQESVQRDEPAASTASVQVAHAGHPPVSADITTVEDVERIAKVGVHTTHAPTDGTHRELVDQVMAHPSVASSDKVHVVVPLGDAETISRLQDHTENFVARAAGASTVIDADIGSDSAGQ